MALFFKGLRDQDVGKNREKRVLKIEEKR